MTLADLTGGTAAEIDTDKVDDAVLTLLYPTVIRRALGTR
jgi:hypothetical protein